MPADTGIDATMPEPRSERLPDDELIVEPDDPPADQGSHHDVERASDAERALREAGGDADRAEDIIESMDEAAHLDETGVPTDERPA